jgi:tetratricopeptide (TPR) repeat protein
MSPTRTPTSIPTPTIFVPRTTTLPNDYHVYQTFNNCGPAALSMTLSYYGINETQEKLGQELRPYQNPQGDNDDKSVTLEELAEKSKDYGLIPYHRPNGDATIIKKAIANGMPVITRTLLTPRDDIGHYRVVKGYDDDLGVFIQDDSLQGKNLTYQYDAFDGLWKQFNYEYLILAPKNKKQLVEDILGEDADEKTAWAKAVKRSQKQLAINPDDIYARLNLSVAYYEIGEYEKSVEEFQKIETLLPMRTLWYQIEPIEAYYELGNYEKVFSLTDSILNNYNRAFSELYILRGKVYQQLGSIEAAKAEFEKAVLYNRNIKIPST